MRAKHGAGVAIDCPFDLVGKNEVLVVFLVGGEIGAGRALNGGANNGFAARFEGAVAAAWCPAGEIFTVIQVNETFGQIGLSFGIDECVFRRDYLSLHLV